MPAAARRKYDASRRRESARRTRLMIAEAARRLFQERGYAGATMEAIAREAGVAKATVYASFKNKRSILAFLLDISIGGDDRPVPLLERPEIRANMREPSQRKQLAVFAGHIAEIMSRAAPIFEITRIAGKTEPAIGERLKSVYADRLRNLRRFAEALAATGPLRRGLDPAHAGEIIWALSSPELFQLMIEYGGWSKEQYAAWLAETLENTLLPTRSSKR